MQELEKLTQDEQGKLHGGFALHSPQEPDMTEKSTNGNCTKDPFADEMNYNCPCACVSPPPSQQQ